jgi:hypothetical protein
VPHTCPCRRPHLRETPELRLPLFFPLSRSLLFSLDCTTRPEQSRRAGTSPPGRRDRPLLVAYTAFATERTYLLRPCSSASSTAHSDTDKSDLPDDPDGLDAIALPRARLLLEHRRCNGTFHDIGDRARRSSSDGQRTQALWATRVLRHRKSQAGPCFSEDRDISYIYE